MKRLSPWLLGLAALALCACGRARAGSAQLLQGVVQYEERVLAFEVGGRVVDVPVERGQDLAAGALVARLDDALQRATRERLAADLLAAQAALRLLEAGARKEELDAAESEIAALQAQAATLRKDLARQEALRAGSAIAQSEVDRTSGELEATLDRRHAMNARLTALRTGPRSEEIAAAAARVQSAQAALRAEDLRLARHELRALASGSVVDLHLDPGEMAAPGTPIATIADLGRPYVDVFVPQAQAPAFRLKQPVRVTVDGIDGSLRGQVEHIFPKLEFTPRFLFSEGERPKLVVRMRVRVSDPEHVLRGGLPAFVGT